MFLGVVLPTLGRLKEPPRFEVFFGDLMVKKQGGGCCSWRKEVGLEKEVSALMVPHSRVQLP